MTTLPEGFVRFWAVYPRHTAKGAAIKAWEKINPDEEMVMRICHSLADQKNYRQKLEEKNSTLPERKQKFIPDWPHPSTWLNGARWDDEIPSTSDVLLVDKQPDACSTEGCHGKGTAKAYGKIVCCRCYTLAANPGFLDPLKAANARLGWKRKEGETNQQTSRRTLRANNLQSALPEHLKTEDDC